MSRRPRIGGDVKKFLSEFERHMRSGMERIDAYNSALSYFGDDFARRRTVVDLVGGHSGPEINRIVTSVLKKRKGAPHPNIAEYEADVRRPGKFQGEASYVPYFYGQFLDGGADYEKENKVGFKVSPEDKAMFPELRGKRTVWLWLRDDGFVQEV